VLLTKPVSTNARPFLIQWLILGLGMLALGGAIGYSITNEHNRIDALEQERLMTQAKVVDANLGHQLVSLNRALVSFRNDLPYWKTQKDSKVLINRHLKAMSDALPGVRTLHITDSGGTVFASNRKELIGFNFREREYFRAALQGLNPKMLYVSPPFKTVLGVYAVNAVMVVLDARGAFTGIVSSTLDPEYCTVLLNSVLYTSGMRASLIHGDGKIFVETPGKKGLAGMDLNKPGSRFTRHKESGREANVFSTGRSLTTGDYRMSAWRTIRPASLLMDKPLMISVNRDMQGIFASWRRDAFMQGGLFGLLALVAVVGLSLYQRRQKKYEFLTASYTAELQNSEKNYRGLFQNASIGIFHSLPEGKFLRVNPALAKMFGYGSPEEMISSVTNISTQIYVDSKKHSSLLAITTEKTDWVYAENSYRCKDGTVLTANLSVRKVLNSEDTVAYLEGFVEDITERKQIEVALRENEERFRRISSMISDVVYSCKTDDEGRFTINWMTGAAERISGYSTGEIISRKCWRFMVVEEDLALFEKNVTDLAPGSRGECELRIRRKNGEIVWIASYAECVLGSETPEHFHLYGGLIDITDRKRIADALRESENRYRELSIVDDLTRLYNSRYFYHQLRMEIDRVDRYGQPLTLLLLDLDDFKTFNDTYGHVEGDQVLFRIGQVVKRCLRQTDSAYRYGGEEFTILLPMTTSADGAVTAERIRMEFKEEIFSPAPGQDVHVTVSIGLGQYKTQEDMKVFVHRVDQLMYQGKKNGKDTVCSEL
jgi:diguanylate cyclase (GGDEF)-like protein/PAS domain S-box-containing protein